MISVEDFSSSSSGRYQRVLVLTGEPFNRRTATGITLSNLFDGWPSDQLFQVYTAEVAVDPTSPWPVWRLSNADLELVGGAYRAWRGALPNHRSPPTEDQSSRNADGVLDRVKATLRSALVPWLDLVPYRLPLSLITELDRFQPQLVYSLLGNIRLTRVANAIAARYRIPVLPHFMDDWLTTYSVPGKSAATFVSRPVLRQAVTRLMTHAQSGLAIGDAMAEEYSAKFARPFVAFMNPVTVSDLPSRRIVSGRARFGYVGGLHLSRYANLIRLARSLGTLAAEGLDVSLAVWAPAGDLATYGNALTDAGIRCASVAPHDVEAQLRNLDIAVHVESFGRQEEKYTRLSVSTKIPQYLAQGLPIFAYAPCDAASSRYIADNDCGTCHGNPTDGLTDALRAFVQDASARRRMAKQGHQLARERHDATAERRRFADVLNRAASHQPVDKEVG